jgi:hypothetical protein
MLFLGVAASGLELGSGVTSLILLRLQDRARAESDILLVAPLLADLTSAAASLRSCRSSATVAVRIGERNLVLLSIASSLDEHRSASWRVGMMFRARDFEMERLPGSKSNRFVLQEALSRTWPDTFASLH